ncbi:hypothetical protein XELAEV_18045248mg [Xenopus laevis]|uniref:Uncharacterized protein n=1 Tax=Xenopus laevis TaxID=8355 RepID=A0A974C087_XENLA|nr:hypothetical protein XELAEV_18045248mg [Xenopus laevis]
MQGVEPAFSYFRQILEVVSSISTLVACFLFLFPFLATFLVFFFFEQIWECLLPCSSFVQGVKLFPVLPFDTLWSHCFPTLQEVYGSYIFSSMQLFIELFPIFSLL